MLVCTFKELSSMYILMVYRVSRDEQPLQLLDLYSIATRTAGTPLKIPARLLCRTPAVTQDRFIDSPVYPALETNVDAGVTRRLLPGTHSRN